MDGLIFRWAYIWNGVNVKNLVGLYMGELIFRGGLILRGLFTICNNPHAIQRTSLL